MSGVVDGSLPELPGFFYAQVVLVATVQHAVGIRRAGADAEDVVGQTSAVSVHVVETGTL